MKVETETGTKYVNLVWNNPCFTMTYDTLEEVMKVQEFSVKDFLDLETGEVVYQLEHEIRSTKHPSFQIHLEQ